jgi:hypothetical protein
LKNLLFLLLIFPIQIIAQSYDCTFKQPQITLHFGKGNLSNLNMVMLPGYGQVSGICPTDGHYTYTSYTSDCFRGDWFTLTEDHTPGDVDGNMLLVNASPYSGAFFYMAVNGLKGGTTYEFAVWMMNVCKISEKCPFPLLPDITIQLQTPEGKSVAQLAIGELSRRASPAWTHYRAVFTTPVASSDLVLTMINNNPGGCGNDFALDDITFRECIKSKPAITRKPAVPNKPGVTNKPEVTNKPAVPNKPAVTSKPAVPDKPTVTGNPKTVVTKKPPVTPKPVAPKKQTPVIAKAPALPRQILTPEPALPERVTPVIKQGSKTILVPPPVLTTRTNTLIRKIETEAGVIRLDLYDNGQIDGDTVSIYHNNVLLVSRARLSDKPISFNIKVDSAHRHHELIMVAENLGSIPPNTSVMIVTAGNKRHEVFITASEQKNAKVIIDLN